MLSMLVVVALWVHNRGVQDLTGVASGLTSLGRLTGLVSADLLLVQVLLMARVPWVERTFGQDRLAAWHRWTGFTSFNLMLAHIVLITVGYAASENAGLPGELWRLVTTYPGMLLAAAATVALTLVVVTSVRAARRRLRYESWHLLHLYAYLGVALAIPHELWTGTDFVFSPAARAYWWTIYLAAAGCLALFRLGLPAWRTLRHRPVVSAVVPEGPGVFSVYLRGRHLDRLPARAGQFFLWRFLDGPGWSRANPYSLSAGPRPDLLRVTVKDLGEGSRRVATIRPGTRVLVEGPYGRLTAPPADGRPITMIASGVGITPLRALLDEVRVPVTLLYRARTADDLLFKDELDAAVATGRLQVGYLVGPRSREGSWVPAGFRDDQLRRWVPGIRDHHVYVCGPDAWMSAASAAVLRAGVPPQRLHTERFSW
ncbi:ferric reductase-like transmembrane domain-containing protein [Dactylosporangium salmoneum]|uniref:Ferric reductase-like transmembrane domain-containing protein n=2 Tax=Dactylosporangium salmoneum TaxID=53361 RepID=A0ABP5TP25_9ACTN